MSGTGDGEEEYRGPVTVVVDGAEVFVDAHLAGHFDPLTGTYRWVGRLAPAPEVSARFAAGRRAVLLRTPDGHEGRGELLEADLWGGHRVRGSGRPPFAVPELRADEL
ncbi:DUF4873 domain-containing protein [Thermobifida halotolerans]|uniref:DUF4873 domain-containing protein n=1 Tax=Thermobifida halotolerans TaxID=483545 RepID=A0A399G7T2_9ACTN|nr:DUF4873 domain-containing protein [Thermobifida halotolerans]UOE18066.1 DUF4873 domain-containing protein [Thermobifida halotolerans]